MSILATTAILGGAAVGAALVTGARVFGLRRMVKHSTKTDVAFTGGIGFLLAGTLAGMGTALVAGLMMALVLSVLKVFYRGADKVADLMSREWFPIDLSDDEHNAKGEWIYNSDQMTRGMA